MCFLAFIGGFCLGVGFCIVVQDNNNGGGYGWQERSGTLSALYELDKAIYEVIEQGMSIDEETGEIVWDEDNLDQLVAELDTKRENVGLYIKNLTADVDMLKAEEKNLKERRQVKERKIERLKDYLTRSMELTGDKSLETARIKMSFRKSTSVNIIDIDEVPEFYVKEKIEYAPDKALIKKALQAGQLVKGAELKETQNLQIK